MGSGLPAWVICFRDYCAGLRDDPGRSRKFHNVAGIGRLCALEIHLTDNSKLHQCSRIWILILHCLAVNHSGNQMGVQLLLVVKDGRGRGTSHRVLNNLLSVEP
jgi:hypothetical protein